MIWPILGDFVRNFVRVYRLKKLLGSKAFIIR